MRAARLSSAAAAAALLLAVAPSAQPGARATRTITWSGYTWTVSSSGSKKAGPGPNYFSDSSSNVWVDSAGRLHLVLKKSKDRWYCASITNTQSLGYGRYSWTTASPVNALDKNAVLGLFTWSDDPTFNNREIDIEASRWGDGSSKTNSGWTVQPYTHSGNGQDYTLPAAPSTTESFHWTAGRVDFATTTGTPASWSYTGPDVPPAGGEHPHMNLWLFRGKAPKNAKTIEVVFQSFTFTAG